jgi:tetratricopeptide (TPR) repeat protein/cold shock CspA family protein
MEIPSALIDQVKSSNVVLFLGAGASLGATLPNGEKPLTANGLRGALSDRFLGGEAKDETLDWVADLAINQADISTVQDYIADKYKGIEPSRAQELIAAFRWKGLATTNYDCLIESIYERVEHSAQNLVPMISDDDRVADKLRSSDDLRLLKLHGCITRTHDQELPLILTIDQYNDFRTKRRRLFGMLREWGSEHSIVFVGYGLRDADLRHLLSDMTEQLSSLPRYYIVKPNVSSMEQALWAGKNIGILNGTLEEFLKELDVVVPLYQRELASSSNVESPIMQRFVTRESMPSVIADMLENDAQYVDQNLESGTGNANRFYKGFDLGWYPILGELDVQRDITEDVLWDVVARPEEDRPTESELYVIKGEAGAGKTIILRRLAWRAATESDSLCLFALPLTTPSFEAIRELYRVTQSRIFLFIDSVTDNVSDVRLLIQDARRHKIHLTVVTTARVNEWNVLGRELRDYLTQDYRVPYLSTKEIEQLVILLQNNEALGSSLQGASFEEQVAAFKDRAGRQLLVALYEATSGRPFEDILYDEYQNIYPQKAQLLYVTICLLYRLNVPVRAGLIARVHGISFEQFSEEFFAPLEHVVQVVKDRTSRDYAYAARHPEIAQVIFDRVLRDRRDRYNEYINVMKFLNISYSSDEESFRKMVNAYTLRTLFPDYEDVKSIFNVAEQCTGEDAYLYQQMANYERIERGDLSKALELLQRARELDPRNSTIIHTNAEVARAQAKEEQRPLEKLKLRSEAKNLLDDLLNNRRSAKYAHGTLINLYIDECTELLNSNNPSNKDVDESIRQTERVLQEGKQQFPDDPNIRRVEARFARLINDHERSFRALDQAFQINPRDPDIATRLASTHEKRGDILKARDILGQALSNNGMNKQLNFHYGQILRKIDPNDMDNVLYHFRRAFADGDGNYEAQFWYARYAFESDEPGVAAESKDMFQYLRTNAPVRLKERRRIRDTVTVNGSPKQFLGIVSRVEARHGFITMDGRGENLFFHGNDLQTTSLDGLRRGQKVVFNIGFTFNGPQGCAVRPT